MGWAEATPKPDDATPLPLPPVEKLPPPGLVLLADPNPPKVLLVLVPNNPGRNGGEIIHIRF